MRSGRRARPRIAHFTRVILNLSSSAGEASLLYLADRPGNIADKPVDEGPSGGIEIDDA